MWKMSNSAQGIVKTAATFTGTVRARKHRIALYDSDGERLSYDGLADYQVLDGEGNILDEGKVEAGEDIVVSVSEDPKTVKLMVGEVAYSFDLAEEQTEA